MVLSIRMTTCMAFSLLYLALHWDSKPFSQVSQDVAVCIAGLFTSSASFLFRYYRIRTSALLRTINEINRNIQKRDHNDLENRRVSNRMFLGLSIYCIIFQILGTMACLMFGLEFAYTGLPQFNSFLYQPTPYSVMAFVDVIAFLCPCCWTMTLCTLYLTMYIEFNLKISFYFRVTAEEMRQLRRAVNFNEEEELNKLKSLIKDLNLFHW